MFQLSDSDSVDSDEGIRFKTDNVRNKDHIKKSQKVSHNSKNKYNSRHHKSEDSKELKYASSSKSRSYRNERRSSSLEKERHKKSRDHSMSDNRHNSYNKAKQTKEIRHASRGTSPRLTEKKDCNGYNDRVSCGPAYSAASVALKCTSEKQKSNEDCSHNTKIIDSASPSDLFKKKSLDVMKKSQLHERDDELPTAGPSLPPHMSLSTQCNNEEASPTLGPSLPPRLQSAQTDTGGIDPSKQKKEKCKEINSEECDESEVENKLVIGPVLPPHLINDEAVTPIGREIKCIIGPDLPPHCQNANDESPENTSIDIIGPSLPSHLQQEHKPQVEARSMIGPSLPSHLRSKLSESNNSMDTDSYKIETVNVENESEDDEIYGPLPPGIVGKTESQIALEERALQLKLEQMEPNKSDLKVREDWMLQLPENRASNLGLGPRQFRSKMGPDLTDRSCWTDTPEDKNKKKKQKGEVDDTRKIAKQKEIDAKDALQEEIIKKHKKKHKESLLEMHQKKIKKQKQDEGPSERRPFSRELDLQVNRFDEAQKKSVLKKAQLLDDRFMKGQSKFI